MGGIALLAKEAGHVVTGSDQHVYPPMSTQLEAAGIHLHDGYSAAALQPAPDSVIVGNALSRGNVAVEQVLNQGLNYESGPQWLYQHLLARRWVLAVAGTHGKTTTASMLAWILEYAGLQPGFLIGGVPNNFGCSARSGTSDFFVVEADEYDTAFFDKRAKFVHYHPRTLVLNNLEYDHADIYPDIASIQRQFHHLIRTVPGNGLIISNAGDVHLQQTLAQGCWTPIETVGDRAGWWAQLSQPDASSFEVYFADQRQGVVEWNLIGQHNVQNGLSALAAARHAGVPSAHGIAALGEFTGVKRRLEVLGVVNQVTVYDDFAHHPTAITLTLQGLRAQVGKARIIAVVEPRSNTMRIGVHKDVLANALAEADLVLLHNPYTLDWDLSEALAPLQDKAAIFTDVEALLARLLQVVQRGDHILVMSNGGFGGIHQTLLAELTKITD